MNKGIRNVGDMPYDILERTIDQFADISKTHPSDYVSIAPVGLGEPLLYPRFFDAISLIRQKIPKALIHANTNGINLNDEMIDKLYKSDLNELIVSINLWDEKEYGVINKAFLFNLVKENAENLIRKKPMDKKIVIKLQLLNIHLNYKYKSNFKDYWRSLGASTFNRRFSPNSDYILNLMPDEDRKIYDKYFGQDHNLSKRLRYPCPILFHPFRYSVMVDKDGYIYPCCSSLWFPQNSGLCIGNIEYDNIEESYIKVQRIRNIHKRGMWNKIEACKSCRSWAVMRRSQS